MTEEKARRLSGWIAGRTRYANQKRSGRVPPDTNVLDLGARVQAQAIGLGLARAKEVFIVADGALWIWNLIEDGFHQATKTLDFYHDSEHPWSLARHLHTDCSRIDGIRLRPVPRSIGTSRPKMTPFSSFETDFCNLSEMRLT